MGTSGNVLVATAGQAAANSLLYFGDSSAVLPTTVSTALDATLKDAGFLTPDGVTIPTSLSQNDLPVFGSTSPVRTIITQEVITFNAVLMESNKVTEALITRQTLASVTVTSATMSTTRGPARDTVYVAVVDGIDGATSSAFRRVFPKVRVTTVGDETISYNGNIGYPVTCTAYVDNSGVSQYRYTKVTGLT